MGNQLIQNKFLEMGARMKFRDHRPRWRGQQDTGVAIDIGHDRKGEFFDIAVDEATRANIRVVDLRPADRHLLLAEGDSRYLCGHDERHWFVAAVPEKSRVANVEQAKDALMPGVVRLALEHRKVKRKQRHRRRNDAFLRQGEWFFLPQPGFKPDKRVILRNEPIRRGGGKPHMVEMLCRSGGESVYVSHISPNGMTIAQYRAWLHANPKRRDVRWTIMRRDPLVFAKGKVRHSDHKTIVLNGWHRVMMNTETQAQAMRHVVFLD